MNETDFDTLYALVGSRGEGWQEALRDAWLVGPCILTESQKSLLEAI